MAKRQATSSSRKALFGPQGKRLCSVPDEDCQEKPVALVDQELSNQDFVESIQPCSHPEVKTFDFGNDRTSQYVQMKTLMDMDYQTKKNIVNKQWGVHVVLGKASCSEEELGKRIAYLMNRLHEWTRPLFLYAGPVVQTVGSPNVSIRIAVQFKNLASYATILKAILGPRNDRPEGYYANPFPGTPFAGLLHLYGVDNPKTIIIKTGPMFKRGDVVNQSAKIWIGQMFN